jgi:hypothetical protein
MPSRAGRGHRGRASKPLVRDLVETVTPLIDGTSRTLELILGWVAVALALYAVGVQSPVVALVCVGVAGLFFGRWRAVGVLLLGGAVIVTYVANDHDWGGAEDQSGLFALVVAVGFAVGAGAFTAGVALRRALTRKRDRDASPPRAPTEPPPAAPSG